MYKVTKEGHPTEATALHGTSWMRIVVGYDITEDAYRAHLYVKAKAFDKEETRVPIQGTFSDETSALDGAYEVGKEFIDRRDTPSGFQKEIKSDLRRQ